MMRRRGRSAMVGSTGHATSIPAANHTRSDATVRTKVTNELVADIFALSPRMGPTYYTRNPSAVPKAIEELSRRLRVPSATVSKIMNLEDFFDITVPMYAAKTSVLLDANEVSMASYGKLTADQAAAVFVWWIVFRRSSAVQQEKFRKTLAECYEVTEHQILSMWSHAEPWGTIFSRLVEKEFDLIGNASLDADKVAHIYGISQTPQFQQCNRDVFSSIVQAQYKVSKKVIADIWDNQTWTDVTLKLKADVQPPAKKRMRTKSTRSSNGSIERLQPSSEVENQDAQPLSAATTTTTTTTTTAASAEVVVEEAQLCADASALGNDSEEATVVAQWSTAPQTSADHLTDKEVAEIFSVVTKPFVQCQNSYEELNETSERFNVAMEVILGIRSGRLRTDVTKPIFNAAIDADIAKLTKEERVESIFNIGMNGGERCDSTLRTLSCLNGVSTMSIRYIWERKKCREITDRIFNAEFQRLTDDAALYWPSNYLRR